MSEPKVLECGVIGAGIAGLAAAIALRRAGHNVEVFERSTFKNEVGAAITLTPNANLILDQWGFNAAKAGQNLKGQFRKISWDTMEVVYRDPFVGVNEKYGGHKFSAFHRVDLHNGIRELAEDRGASVRLASAVSKIDCDTGTVRLADDAEIKKDVLVIADGIKVSLRTTRQVMRHLDEQLTSSQPNYLDPT